MAPSSYRQKGRSTKLTKTLLIITWIMIIAVLGTGIWFVVGETNKLLQQHSSQISSPTPESGFNACTLLIFTDGDDLMRFSLVKFNPQEKNISVACIPEDTEATVGHKTTSLSGQFKYGGALQAKKAVESALTVSVDRYVICPFNVLESMVESLGGAEYNIESEMYYKDSAGVVVTDLKKGLQTLNGQQVVKFLKYPKWDAAKTANEQAKLCASIINQYADAKTAEKMPELYAEIINQIETNVSVMDISNLQGRYSAFTQTKNPAKATEISGNGDNGFIISEQALKNLREAFK